MQETLTVDDEDIEILHGSQAAAVSASAPAPQNLPFSSAAAASASAAGLAAKQVNAYSWHLSHN